MKEKYESLALADLKAIAKARGLRGTSAMKKAELVELMLAEDEKEKEKAEVKTTQPKGAASRQPSQKTEGKAERAEARQEKGASD